MNQQFQKIKLKNNEVTYYFEDTGKPKVLFIHGFNSDMNFCKPLWNNDYFDVVALDLPGNGMSETEELITIELFQETVKEFVEKLELKNFIVFGHSLGAASAVYLSNHKEVKKTLLMAPYNPFLMAYMAEYLSPTHLKNIKGFSLKEKAHNFLDFATNPKEKFKFLMTSQVLKRSYMENEIYHLFKENADKYEVLAAKDDHIILPSTLLHLNRTLNVKIHWLSKGRHNPIKENANDVISFIRLYLHLIQGD